MKTTEVMCRLPNGSFSLQRVQHKETTPSHGVLHLAAFQALRDEGYTASVARPHTQRVWAAIVSEARLMDVTPPIAPVTEIEYLRLRDEALNKLPEQFQHFVCNLVDNMTFETYHERLAKCEEIVNTLSEIVGKA